MKYIVGAICALTIAGLIACATSGTLREVEQARSDLQAAEQEKTLLEEKVVSLRAALNNAESPEKAAELQDRITILESTLEGKEHTVSALQDRLSDAETKRETEKDESSGRMFGYLDTFLAIIGFGGIAGKGSRS